MIRYDLACDFGHAFDAWFASGSAYDEQERRGLLSCPHCGTPKVSKSIMAPSVARSDKGHAAPQIADEGSVAVREAMREMRRKMIEGSEDVGVAFADEALSMHRGEKPMRSVRGTAAPERVRELVEEGVAIAPLPPESKTN